MNKREFDKLGLTIGKKFDLVTTKKGSPCNVIFDGIKEHNDYGLSETYILYHYVEAVELKDVISIVTRESSKNNSVEQKIDAKQQGGKLESNNAVNNVDHNTTDSASVVTESPTEEQNKEPKATNKTSASMKKYECSCGKIYWHYASWHQHAKKTGHAKKE
jgi:hypothetical protein